MTLSATERYARHGNFTQSVAVWSAVAFQIFFWAMIFTGRFPYAFIGLAANAALGWAFLAIRGRKGQKLLDAAMEEQAALQDD